MLEYQEWGRGDPAIALHPLALEASAFGGVAQGLAAEGIRTVAVDLPGFGRTPVADGVALTPAYMAEQVLELARSLERPPLLIGFSMGGRVALEAALEAPGCVRGVVAIAPFLPWTRWRRGMEMMRHVDPAWAERLRLEGAWPLLKRVTDHLVDLPRFEHDWLARASVRCAYYLTCPATRVAFLNAAREMCLDPATGPESLWERLPSLEVPATFLWAGRDGLIPREHWEHVSQVLPSARQLEVPCSGHFVSGAHFRCMRHAIVLATKHNLQIESGSDTGGRDALGRTLAPCLAHTGDLDPEVAAEAPEPEPVRAAGAEGGIH